MIRYPNHAARKGMALITALVVMAVLAIILSVVTMQVVSQRRTIQQRTRQMQADWLARAGVELAVARLLESPVAFMDDKQQLQPDAKLRITVEKSGADLFTVTAAATVGAKDEPLVARTASGLFRRTDKGGVVRIEPVPAAKG